MKTPEPNIRADYRSRRLRSKAFETQLDDVVIPIAVLGVIGVGCALWLSFPVLVPILVVMSGCALALWWRYGDHIRVDAGALRVYERWREVAAFELSAIELVTYSQRMPPKRLRFLQRRERDAAVGVVEIRLSGGDDVPLWPLALATWGMAPNPRKWAIVSLKRVQEYSRRAGYELNVDFASVDSTRIRWRRDDP